MLLGAGRFADGHVSDAESLPDELPLDEFVEDDVPLPEELPLDSPGISEHSLGSTSFCLIPWLSKMLHLDLEGVPINPNKILSRPCTSEA